MKTEIKNIIKRKCIVTNEINLTSNMVRFDFDRKNNIISLDLNRTKKGRGAYFVPSKENWDLILRKKILNKVFRTAVNKEVYQKITEQLEENLCLKKTD